jgi:hypothetical protein
MSRGRARLGIIAEGRWPVPLALAVLALLAYANALANGFVLDDRGIVLDNPLVREPGTAWRAFLTPYWPAAIGGGQYRPLGILSFVLDGAIAGPSAMWYHAVNVAWHAAATVLLWVWIRGFLAPAGALVAAALFAVHPVHVEAVANVVGRLELMAAAFIFAALVAHRRGSWFAPLLFACALLSKEHAVVGSLPSRKSRSRYPSRGLDGPARPTRRSSSGTLSMAFVPCRIASRSPPKQRCVWGRITPASRGPIWRCPS